MRREVESFVRCMWKRICFKKSGQWTFQEASSEEGHLRSLLQIVADKRTLQSHLRICSKHPQQQVLPQTEEQARPHKCDHCFRRYIHKKDLMHHLWQQHQDKLWGANCIPMVWNCTLMVVRSILTDILLSSGLCLLINVSYIFLLYVPCSAKVRPQFYSGIWAEQCAFAVTHLLSSSCTIIIVPLHPHMCLL